jgi:hypothetical protein
LKRPNFALDGGAATVSAFQRGVSRGMSGNVHSALIQTEAGLHSPVGQRHLLAPRL